MFKLQQLQKLDEATLSRLVDRFAELDGGGTKDELVIGQEIPSAAQVEELQRKLRSSALTAALRIERGSNRIENP